jgi:hypothetical protein
MFEPAIALLERRLVEVERRAESYRTVLKILRSEIARMSTDEDKGRKAE